MERRSATVARDLGVRDNVVMNDSSREPQARVMIVDDHPMWRDAVERDLVARCYDVVATAGSVREAVDRARATRPDLVLMDMNLPDGNGADATSAIMLTLAEVKVLVLSASSARSDVLDAVKVGASGYLLKSASAAELVDAVEATLRGDAVFTPELAGLVLAHLRGRVDTTNDPASALTPRESEVLRMVAKGLASKQIASRLGLSSRTVDNHVAATLRKLHLANRVELTRFALENGLD
ncbi:response regulator transcription factor [Dermacoccus nishinomiyaensis]|nr:response regulator transcription factor [Dermacoccus nishinomiyaensis]